eukprot:Lithocolla_globosa_v1_NODE_4099_length_1511_cov_23.146291.p2 type:complete len:134 gc:universal NODE_4099_length_1511_cov_23.146291:1102-1503(+)
MVPSRSGIFANSKRVNPNPPLISSGTSSQSHRWNGVRPTNRCWLSVEQTIRSHCGTFQWSRIVKQPVAPLKLMCLPTSCLFTRVKLMSKKYTGTHRSLAQLLVLPDPASTFSKPSVFEAPERERERETLPTTK